MQSTSHQFRDLPDPADSIDIFERLFRGALKLLLPDLADAPWYVRERDVVNLFVFGHLVPQFRAKNLDTRQIAIEVLVQKVRESDTEKLARYADIVVWPHNKATIWRACKPLVQIEWKNISCREKDPGKLKRQHMEDIGYLTRDRQWASVGYAVLTEWHPFPRERSKGQKDCYVEVHCKRVSDEGTEDFFSDKLAATCSENAIAELQGSFPSVRSGPPTCPDCATAALEHPAISGDLP